jgi:hypothetical protein
MARYPEVSTMRRAHREAGAVVGMVLWPLRLAGRVSPYAWLALAVAALIPWWLRYFAWALGQCGVVTFMPRS